MDDEPISEPAPRKPDSGLALSGRRALEATVESVSGNAAPPERLGPYQVSKRLGRGAFGEVYLGFDPELKRSVALKLLRDSGSPDATERLRKEAQAMAALDHPALLTVYGLGEFEGRVYIAMEFAERGTMRDWLRREPRSTESIVVQIVHAARGLHAAHEAGFVHRDVKPSNILIGNDGLARVSDFGLVYAETAVPTVSVGGSASMQTAMGGTPPYMAPELFDPSPPTPQSDEFALCVALFEALFDRRPNWQQMVIEGVDVPAQRKRPPGPVPAWLRDVLVRGLKTDPRDRYETLAALADALERGLGRASRVRNAIVGLGVVSLAVGLGWAVRSPTVAGCTESAAAFADAWNEDRVAAVGAAIHSSGLSFAEQTWTDVRTTLDAYATGWTEAHQQACRATVVLEQRSDELMDRSMACLAARKRHFVAFVAALESGGASAVVDAPVGARELPTLHECNDVERLVAGVELPPKAKAGEIEQLSAALANADALRRIGAFETATAALDELVPNVEAVGYGPLRQDLAVARASLASALMQPTLESSELLLAYAGASRAGRLGLASTAARKLAVALAWSGDHDGGDRWMMLAEAASSVDDDAAAKAGLAGARADLASLRGDPAQASRAYESAVSILEDAFGPQDVRLVVALRDLGGAYSDLGDEAIARSHYERALALATDTLGARHPVTAGVVQGLASLACGDDDAERCEQLAKRALSIDEEVFGPEHPSVADDLCLLARAAEDQGRSEEARSLFERANAIYAAAPSTAYNSARLAALDGLSGVNAALGDMKASAQFAERSVELARASLPAGHPRFAQSLSNLARVRGLQDRAEDSLALADEADAMLVRRLGPEHPERVDILGVRTAALMYLERYPEAIATAGRQLHIITDQLGADHPLRAQPLYNIATSLEADGRLEEAEQRYSQSLAAVESGGIPGDPGAAYPLIGLARIWLATDQAARAVEPLERALPLLEGQAQLRADAQAALARALVLSAGDRARAERLFDEAERALESLGGSAAHGLEELRRFRQQHGL